MRLVKTAQGLGVLLRPRINLAPTLGHKGLQAGQQAVVHSIDRLKIAQRLAEQRPAHLPPLQVCLQVNTDGGPTKSGAQPQELLDLARAVMALPRLVLRGLMTIPDPVDGFEAEVALHRRATALFEQVRQELAPPQWDTLSMGMTADLEAAIAAGSTLVRVGTAIFGRR